LSYLRPKKAEQLRKVYADYENRTGKLRVRTFENRLLTPIGYTDVTDIEEQEGQILDDEGLRTESSPATNLNEIKHETVIFAGYLRLHFGHFLVNTVSRLWFLYTHPEVKYDKIVFARKPDEDPTLRGNMLEILNVLGITDKLEIIEVPTAYEKVIVPDNSISRERSYYSEEYNLVYDRLRELILKDHCESARQWPKRIYFTRTKFAVNANRFSEIGAEAFDEYFKQIGFEIIAPEQLDIRQLICLLEHAEIVASPIGTVSHNILFGRKNTKLILLEKHWFNNDYQAAINLSKGLMATYIDSHLTIKNTDYSCGPLFYYPTPQFVAFLKDNDYTLPDKKFFSEQLLRKNLQMYFRIYKQYRYILFTRNLLGDGLPILMEAYEDSSKIIGKYLHSEKAIFFSDNFAIWRKQFVSYVSQSKSMLKLVHKLRQLVYQVANV
jgi:capsular polysaccharide biosynthesis protein